MADHYGSAELIAGRLLARRAAGRGPTVAFTKWCPTPGPMTPRGRARRRRRAAWTGSASTGSTCCSSTGGRFEHPGYLDAMRELRRLREEGRIAHLGVTNFDTDHLRILVGHGIPVASNQVCFSLLDRRAAEDMSAFCLENGVRLLAYGTLGGGFLTDRWLGAPEPAADRATGAR